VDEVKGDESVSLQFAGNVKLLEGHEPEIEAGRRKSCDVNMKKNPGSAI
jgi:hypothetical protein